jgi:hypothetical protein
MSAASILRKARQRFAAWALCSLIVCGCRAPLDVGSSVLWATNHESGTIADWTDADGGGLLPDTTNSLVEISDSFAHSGRYALKLTDKGASDSDGPGVFREITSPPDLYYSAWYYVPRTYVTNSQWTIQQFRSRSDADPNVVGKWHDLNLRTLPGGQVLLYIYSHNMNYLQASLANPPAFVLVETWFQLESLYRPRTDETGLLKVWLDDRLVYDLEGRVTAGSNDVQWGPCNIAEDVQPTPPEIYVDDAAISVVRVTRAGKLFADY